MEVEAASGASGRDKISRIFRFLTALNEHRNPAIQDLSDQPWCLRLRSIPVHPSVSVASVQPSGNESDAGDVIVRVARPKLTPPPDPPASLRDWLRPAWSDASRPLELRPSRNETTADGRGVVVAFEADAGRVRDLEVWRPIRDAWAANELPALRTLALFEQLYELHGRIDREAERVELVLGDGLLSWRRAEGGIFHPLLLQRVQLQFDPSIPQFTVCDTGDVPDLYTALLRGIDEIDGKVLARCRAELAEGVFLPLGGADTSGFLKRLGNTLSAAAEFSDSEPPRSSDVPRIGRDPVLFLRTRNLGFAKALEGILADLPRRTDLPASLLRIVGIEPEVDDSSAQDNLAALWSEPLDVLLSKPANVEQIEIAQRLDRHGCVLVQGPPGTGKTHTIANLIGHLLAQGKSVLVTSHTTKALRVLRDQVVPELQPLCVSVLENDLESRTQLESAVTSIAERLSSSNATRLDLEAERLQDAREGLVHELHAGRAALVEAQSDEYRDVVLGGRSWLPSDAARLVAREGQHAWIPGPVALGEPCPITQEELIDLHSSNAFVSAAQESELGLPLPSPDQLVPPAVATDTFARLRSLQHAHTDPEHRPDLWAETSVEKLDADLPALGRRCVDAVRVLDSAEAWKLVVLDAGASAKVSEVWSALLAMIDEVSAQADAARELLLRHDPKVGLEGDPGELLATAQQIRAHLESGGSLGALALLTRGSWKSLLRASQVASGAPRTAEHLSALEAYLRLRLSRAELCGRWDRQVAVHGAPRSSEFESEPEAACAQFAGEISRCLAWAGEVWTPLEQELERWGLRFGTLLNEQPPILTAHGALLRLHGAVTGPLQRVLAAQDRILSRHKLELQIAGAVRELDAWGGPSAPSGTVRELVRALDARDGEAYTAAFARLVDLLNRRNALERRWRLIGKIEQVAKAWAAGVRDRRGIHGDVAPPGDVEQAWTWRQLNDELERRGAVDLAVLQAAIDRTSEELRRTTADLIERRAWAGQVRRTGLRARQALEGWLQTIQRIGKGTGKRAPRLRTEAARKMSECREAVPVWVMPLAQVVENFDARTRFDCVIVDEASQSDVFALTAMYMAETVVVVGDNEQVSPSAVGQKLDIVQQLIDEHLTGIPNHILYDGQTSIYDLARQSFGGTLCLTEHFRCVPAIVEFSNQLSYEGRIKPLRESTSTALEPALLLHRVEGRSRERLNPVEARAVASLLIATMEHPAYASKTFGVISLVGDEQALEIERLLRQHVHPTEFERRRILCGNAAQFQGDERDVMFLSMVDTPTGGPLTLRADKRFKQRFNVAVSRARDQLWLVHSLSPETDLKPDDLRRRLIEHCKSPFGMSAQIDTGESRLESPFERAVFERLVRAGYRVAAQWQVGHYRIDLVVEGGAQRLAVECDGDRYHPVDMLPEDMARQAILERLGWRFVRIRGSAFFRDPDAALQPVFARLRELGILPEGDADTAPSRADSEVQTEIVCRAAEIERAWQEPRVEHTPTPEVSARLT